jgi:katanin p80 WD40 repeat-containing subunit B1
MVAAGIDRSVTMHHGKKVVATFDGIATPVSAIGMDKQARRVAVGTDGGSLKLWDMSTGEVIQGFTRGHRTVVTAIDYHPFADFMATASRDTHVRIWDLRKKSCLQTYRHEDGVAAPVEVVRVAPDGRTAASG